MKELKIIGVISIPDDMTLQQFCEMFNEIMDKYDFCFFTRFLAKNGLFNAQIGGFG